MFSMNKRNRVALQKAIKRAGGPGAVGVAVSRHIGRNKPYTRQAVEHWCNGGTVPAEVAAALETVTGFPKYKMRPDLWGGP